MTDPTLEVIACSVSDAIEANKGGANRLEVVRNLEYGGLTPSLELVRSIKSAVELPLRVMLRERVGYEINGDEEMEALSVAGEQFARMGVDGVVIGFLNGARVDIELTRRVLARAPDLRATFHHAFEDAGDRLQAMRDIKSLAQVDRILSSGGSGELKQRIKRLDADARAAAPEIKIVAGGGVDSDAILLLMRTTSIREFHVGRAARSGFRVDGDVEAELVSRLVQVAREGLERDVSS